jgi:hypothetical protein
MGLWIFIIFALIRFFYKHLKQNESSPKVTVEELTYRFSRYTNLAALVGEYSRLLALNASNPEALRVIEQAYLLAKARLERKEERHRFKQDAKAKSIREKNEKIFSSISTLEELKKKYRKLSKVNHPDHGGNPAAMKRLNELYEKAYERITR